MAEIDVAGSYFWLFILFIAGRNEQNDDDAKKGNFHYDLYDTLRSHQV